MAKKDSSIRIQVTQDQIDYAVPRNSSHCMIADAVKTSVPLADHVSVDLQTIRFSRPDIRKRYIYLTPRVAQLALVNWDAGIKPPPFSFRLSSPHIINMYPAKPKRTEGDNESVVDNAEGPRTRPYRPMSEEGKKVISDNMKENFRQQKAFMVALGTAGQRHIPEVEGGVAEPMMRDKDTKTTFSRRRAFGLRGLKL